MKIHVYISTTRMSKSNILGGIWKTFWRGAASQDREWSVAAAGSEKQWD